MCIRVVAAALLLLGLGAPQAAANANVDAKWLLPRHFRNGGSVQALTISPDGRHYAWAEERGAIYVADAATGEVLGHKRPLAWASGAFSFKVDARALRFLPDGTLLALRPYAGVLDRYRLDGPQPHRVLSGLKDAKATVAALSHDGALAAVADGGTVTLASVSDGGRLRVDTLGDEIASLAFGPSGRYLYAGGPARYWRIATFDPKERPEATRFVQETTGRLAISADESRIVCCAAKSVFTSGPLRATPATMTALSDRANCVAAQRGGPGDFAVGCRNGDLVWIESETGRTAHIQKRAHGAAILELAFSPTGSWLLTAGADGTFRRWRSDGARYGGHADGGRHTGAIVALAVSPDGKRLVSCAADHRVHCFDPRSLAHTQQVWQREPPATAVSFATNDLALLGTWDGKLQRVDLASGRSLEPLGVLAQPIVGVAAAKDPARWLVASTAGDVFRVGEAAPQRKQLVFAPPPLTAFARSADGTRIAAAHGRFKSVVRVWSAATGALVYEAASPDQENAVALSPDGTRVAFGGHSWMVRVHDVDERREIARYAHADRITSLDFSSDGALVASASEDTTVQVFHVAKKRVLDRMYGHLGPVRAVAFVRGDQQVASGGDDTAIAIWTRHGR